MLQRGDFAHVPVMVGSVFNEKRKFGDYGRTSNPVWKGQEGQDRFRSSLRYPEALLGEILEEYHAEDFGGNYYLAMERVWDDQYWFAGARRTARWVAAGGAKAFRYQWRHSPTNEPWGLGAYHGSELAFIFHQPFGDDLPPDFHGPSYPLTEAEQALVSMMSRFWTQFAISGDPSGSDSAKDLQWTAYDATVASSVRGLHLRCVHHHW